MKSPLISIVMNCFNSDKYLKDAIDSVYAQTYKNWEIIFWDNASTDKSSSIAKSYDDKLKYFYSDETTSLGKARNLALKKVKGEFISFLDCDDLYFPEKLKIQIELMLSRNYVMSYGSAIIINDKGNEKKKLKVSNKSGYIFGNLLMHYEINMQSVMVNSSFLSKNNLNFAENLKYCPDYNLFMEISSRSKIGVLKDFLVKYRVSDNSLSRSTLDIVSTEIKFTLDNILPMQPELRLQLSREFNIAYKKLHYYDAIAAIYKDDRNLARKKLKPIIYSRIIYFVIYLVLFIPLPKKIFLKALGR